MSQSTQKGGALQAAATKVEVLEGLQRALDQKYEQLLRTAKTDWERLFGEEDLRGVSVTVRSHDVETTQRASAQPGSAFFKPRKTGEKGSGKQGLPRFAH